MKFVAKVLLDTSLCRQYLHMKNSLNRLGGLIDFWHCHLEICSNLASELFWNFEISKLQICAENLRWNSKNKINYMQLVFMMPNALCLFVSLNPLVLSDRCLISISNIIKNSVRLLNRHVNTRLQNLINTHLSNFEFNFSNINPTYHINKFLSLSFKHDIDFFLLSTKTSQDSTANGKTSSVRSSGNNSTMAITSTE